MQHLAKYIWRKAATVVSQFGFWSKIHPLVSTNTWEGYASQKKLIQIGGMQLVEVAYGWTNIRDLLPSSPQ